VTPAASACPGFTYATTVLSGNVADFQASAMAPGPANYGSAYKLDLTITNQELDARTPSTSYDLSTIIRPLVFGKAN
jgi:hypothetical protein